MLVPSVGVNQSGFGEVFRLNLELGRFMKSYEVDVGGDDLSGGGALQGGVHTGSINTAVVAEESHGLSAFGTSIGSIELWDSRARTRVACLQTSSGTDIIDGREEVTALEFHSSGLTLAAGSSAGLIRLYDLRSPTPILAKDQGYGVPIHTLMYLSPSSTSTHTTTTEPKLLSADKRMIKIWSPSEGVDGKAWTTIEPAVDIHSVAWCKDSGMLLTANEGRQQHSFFIPQLGPAPRWCSFLDNLVEEMAEDASDPNAFTTGTGGIASKGEVYDNYKFLTNAQLETLNLSHLIGHTSLLRPYMHGYFVAQRLYDEAKIIADPFIFEEQRNQRVREKIEKERESRIRGNSTKRDVNAKVNKQLARKLAEREDARNERRKRMREEEEEAATTSAAAVVQTDDQVLEKPKENLLTDPRFSQLFSDEAFAIDESSREFQALNPNKSSKRTNTDRDLGDDNEDKSENRRLTAVEQETLDAQARHGSPSSSSSSSDDEDAEAMMARNNGKISTSSYKRSGHRSQGQQQQQQQRRGPKMHISSFSPSSSLPSRHSHPQRSNQDHSFGTRVSKSSSSNGDRRTSTDRIRAVRGDKEISFIPASNKNNNSNKISGGSKNSVGEPQSSLPDRRSGGGGGVGGKGKKDRRSASGNVFRGL